MRTNFCTALWKCVFAGKSLGGLTIWTGPHMFASALVSAPDPRGVTARSKGICGCNYGYSDADAAAKWLDKDDAVLLLLAANCGTCGLD